MSDFKVGDVVVHKSLGSQPLVIVSVKEIKEGVTHVDGRYGTQGTNGLHYTLQTFLDFELETPVESIEREGEIFKTLNAKQNEINSEVATKPGPRAISHLN